MKVELCECGAAVSIGPQEGGRGSGQLTVYQADCPTCGTLADYLGTDGTKRSAERQWNRIRRDRLRTNESRARDHEDDHLRTLLD